MTIRIPRPVNRALDAVERRHWVAVAAMTSAAVVVLAVAVISDRVPAGVAAVAVGAVVFLTGTARAREARLREQVRQRDYDLAAERAEVARLRAGDPSAPTAQLRPIGDRGELT